MSLDPQEEKLFMILQAIEQQGEQNKKTQANIEQIAQTVTEQQDQLAKDRAEFASDRQTFTRAMLQVEDYLKHKANEYERRTEQVELVYLKAVQGATLHSLENNLKPIVTKQIKAGLEDGIADAQNHSAKITNQYTKAITTNTELINDSTEQLQNTLGYKMIAIIGGSIILAFFLIIGFVWWLTPSLDEVKQRRAELAGIMSKTKAQFSNCDGKVCVKVKKDQCNYEGGYCVIDKGWF
jgi:DNA repair exonuclease SbcCD ATPase subunit